MAHRGNSKQMATDMDEHGDMKNDAINQANSAFEQFSEEKEIAKQIKTWFEDKYGPTWHCIVGSGYKTSFTYESKNFIKFNIDALKNIPMDRLLSENEWRHLGVQQSRGWAHYAIHKPEPHILLFRRPLGTDPTTGHVDIKLKQEAREKYAKDMGLE